MYLLRYTDNPPTTDGSVGAGYALVKFNTDGSLCAATVLPFGCGNRFATGIEASGDTLRIVGEVCPEHENSYSTDGSLNISPSTGLSDLWVAKFVFCPPAPTITSDVLSPSTINVCQNGIVEQIIGEEHVIDGASLPPVYIGGVLSEQPDIDLKYQWQVSTSAGGPLDRPYWTGYPTTKLIPHHQPPATSIIAG